MAWRIDESVIRGEIDNREKGIVRGKLWLEGIAEPIVLELTGNACADLAGCLLEFRNPQPTVPMRQDATFATLQRGQIGDLTASRKVRVFDIPTEEAYMMCKRGEKPPEHMANCLYLEWFSDFNGRVVIESVAYQISISAPQWRLLPEDEEQRQKDAAKGWGGFLGKLNLAIEQHQRGAKDPEAEWDEHDYERLLRESDARTDKYMELTDKFGDTEQAQEKIAEEMGWTRELTPEEAEQEERDIEEMNAAGEAALDEPSHEPNPAREGIDWIRTEDGDIRHPLQHRCFQAALRFRRECMACFTPEGRDEDLQRFVFELQTTGAKLRGALQGIAEDRGTTDPAFTVAYLKRALAHLHNSQAGLEAAAAKMVAAEANRLVPETTVIEARRELFQIREQILRLMQELRGE